MDIAKFVKLHYKFSKQPTQIKRNKPEPSVLREGGRGFDPPAQSHEILLYGTGSFFAWCSELKRQY